MLYAEVRFTGLSKETTEMLIAQLSELQYEGFEESEEGLKAYIPQERLNKETVERLAAEFKATYTVSNLPDTNWNQLWESNFQPVIVEDFCAIRADFHEPIKNVQHEIVITPKMSFGTGHHPTTYMMMQQMRDIEIAGNSVLDFGTGTGVLAILAQKLGATNIVAIDNDDWSISNARENIIRNNASSIDIRKADTAETPEKFDIILANIIKNVILDNFVSFQKHINPGGVLVLSGLLLDDEKDIMEKAGSLGFALKKKLQRDNWISLKFE